MHESPKHSANPRGSAPSDPASGRVLTLGILGVAAASAFLALSAKELVPTLHATSTPRTIDSDGDGLPDLLELKLGLLPDQLDTDQDGYDDAEELARKSNGADASSIPGNDPISVTLEVYQDGGPVRPVSVIYCADGNFANKSIAMGARVGEILRNAPVAYFVSKGGTVETLAGKSSGSAVLIIDATFDVAHIERFGSLSLFTTVSAQGKVASADVSNLADVDGVVVEITTSASPGPSTSTGPANGTTRYTPVDTAGPPMDWLAGQICSQTVAVAGSVGAVVVQEVIEASCETGWDAYCDPGCAGTVGSTFETLEPGALIGG